MSAQPLRPLAGQPWLNSPDSRKVVAALTARGRPVRFVGGCVRDGLLGRVGAGADLDLATPERPEAVMALLEAAGIRALPTGLSHGTVTALIDGRHFEITTLRRDVTTDGRRAEVAFTDDFEADAARRDLTINAMSCDAQGRLFDYFGGREDLAAGRVRFVGDPRQRIAEDYLRILRFFRFFAGYGRGPADPAALAACREGVPGLARLSGERIQTEMMRLLAAPDPLPSLRLMDESGVLAAVLAGPGAIDRLERLLALAPGADPVLRLAALLRPPPADGDQGARVAARWRLSRADAERLLVLAGAALPQVDADPQARRQALYRVGSAHYSDLVRLAAAERGADAAPGLADALAAAAAWPAPVPPLWGKDVVAAGVAPGPEVGRLLAEIEGWWAEADFRPDRAACLERLRQCLAARAPAASA